MTELREAKKRYAEEIAERALISSPQVLQAFQSVPRERFLDPGPWRLRVVPWRLRNDLGLTYGTTKSDNPAHLYHDVLVAIDEGRGLDNGLPSLWASIFAALEIAAGEHVFQVGCGTGYYTAILAELVGPTGRVTAVDCDEHLAERARENLSDRSNVEVLTGDACRADHMPGQVDVVTVHAGAAYPPPVWLDALSVGGRMEVPITADDRQGMVFIFKRVAEQSFAAQAFSRIELYPCIGARDEKDPSPADWETAGARVKSLRRDDHDADATCWLHTARFCLSEREAGC